MKKMLVILIVAFFLVSCAKENPSYFIKPVGKDGYVTQEFINCKVEVSHSAFGTDETTITGNGFIVNCIKNADNLFPVIYTFIAEEFHEVK